MTRDPVLTVLGALASEGLVAVHNARGGFACNSSSSHSIVVLPEGMELVGDSGDYDGTWGRNDFALTEPGEKIRYLSAMLASRSYARAALAQLREQTGAVAQLGDSVDHQSHLNIPDSFEGEGCAEFVADLGRFLASDRVAILGGNDEGGSTRHLQPGMVAWDVDGWRPWRARRDTVDGRSWWVLFNDYDGTKLRISLDPAQVHADATAAADAGQVAAGDLLRQAPFVPEKAGAPELVDVKITDACAYEKDCGFCYMGSTRSGTPGDVDRVAALLTALSEQQVFEIAFGGGEPTLWPGFTQTLHFTRTLGMVPNFTTKNYTWLAQPVAADWLDLVGAVAFSVNSRQAMDRLTAKADTLAGQRDRYGKITVQLIPDLVPAEEFRHIVSEATSRGWRVTLLGYKDVGRGADFTPAFSREPGWWLTELQQLGTTRRLTSVAIDTALAVESADVLAQAGVPSWMYHLEEGRFSAYVDAVTGRMGPSSYAGAEHLTPLDLDADPAALSEEVSALFATYTGREGLPC